jgi:hypothetical protein
MNKLKMIGGFKTLLLNKLKRLNSDKVKILQLDHQPSTGCIAYLPYKSF